MSLSRHRKDERPWLTIDGGRPALVLFVVGTGWVIAVAIVYSLRGDVGFALFNDGIALIYGCTSFPARLSLRRASLCGVGLLMMGIGILV